MIKTFKRLSKDFSCANFISKKIISFCCVFNFLLFADKACAQVSTSYVWSPSLQTYKASGSTTSTTPAGIVPTFWDDETYTGYKFPFNFNYNGTLYTAGIGTIGIDSDGWIAFSTGAITMSGTYFGGSWVSASDHTGVYLNGTGNNNGFCGFNSDVEEQIFANFTGNTTIGSPIISAISDFSNIRVGVRLSGTGIPDGTIINAFNAAAQTVTMSSNATAAGTTVAVTPRSSIYAFLRGIAPYRQFVIQWTRASRFSAVTGDDFSFQLVLNEGGGLATYQTLQAVYGNLTTTNTGSQNGQVGLRGASSSDFNARTTNTNWSGTTAAVANTATCAVTTSVFPTDGLTYTWSPPCSVAASNAGAISGTNPVCPGTTVDYAIAGVPGAIFYTWTYTGTNTTYSATTTLPLNTLVFASNATGGTLTVTPGNLCGSGTASSIAINVNSVTTAAISYPAPSGYCISVAGTKTPTLTGPAGGTYSASPAGLSIIPSTGVITPATSTAGIYLVTYTYTSGTCTSLSATTTVSIGAIPTISVTATPSIVCSGGTSQLQAVGEAPGNYTVASIAYSSAAPVETPTSIFDGETPYSGVDTVSAAITLPFNFSFYGLPVTQLFVSENGYIQLQTGPDPASNVPQGFSNPAAPNNVIAMAWADLVLDTLVNPGANVRYFVNGISPNQVFIIEYTGLSFFSSPNVGTVNGQIRLYESDNHIEVSLASVNDGGLLSPKTIGIENSLGTLGVSAPGRNSAIWNVATPEAWAFYPKGVSYLWTPSTFLNNAAIQNPVASNVTSSQTYNVKVTDASTGCFANASVTVAVGSPLNGTYTVGATGNYPTITAAIYAYNNLCITGPVTFLLIDNNYSTNETFPITINSNIYASATKTLTIKPASTVTSVTVTGLNSKAIFKLNGADYVIFDGSKTVNGTTRDLTITNTYTKKNGSVFWLSSASASNGATNDTVKNCNFSGFSIGKTSFLLVSSGSTIGGVAAAANSRNAYINNQFTKGLSAISLVGPAGNETGNLVYNNLIGSNVAASKIGFIGIGLYQQANCKVSLNTIAGLTTATTNTTSGISVFGTANGISIDANKISDIKNTNATGFGANGICLASTSTTANVTVSNNFIFDITGKGYTLMGSADNGYGIIVDGGAGYFIDFNTVVLNTNQANSGFPAALNITANTTTNNAVTIRNNILGNTQTQAGEHYVIASSVVKAKIALIDYNNYYLTSGNMGFLGSNRANLAAVVTGFGGNVNSKNILPVFVSATDYHIVPASNAALTNLGTPITGLTADIDTTTRNGLTPDIGADEWLMPNTGSWVGKTSTDWLVPTNWETNKIPDRSTDVTVTGGYTFMPTILTTQPVRGLQLSAPVPANTPILTLGSAGVLQAYGTITRTGGNIDGANGTLEMDSSIAAQPIPANLFVNNNLKNLVVNNSASVSINGTLDVYRSVAYGAAGSTLTTNGNLTFKSTATETAWLGNMTGKTLAGTVTIERYIPTGINHSKTWQLLAAPIKDIVSIKASWMENNASLGDLVHGFGTTISSEVAGATARGYDFYTPASGSAGGPSLKTYVPATNNWAGVDDGVTATSSRALTPQKKGYFLFVRGDRSVITSGGAAVPTILRIKGTAYTTGTNAPPTTTVLPNSFETIGNPYPSAIDFTLVTKPAGVDNVFYVWDPKLPGTNSLGGYQTISSVTGWLPTPGSTNYPAATPVKIIQSGQAFFVHGTAGGVVSFTEATKVSGSSLVVRQQSAPNLHLLRLDLYKVSSSYLGPVDGNVVALDKDYSNAFDNKDALKISNSTENIGIASNDKILAVEARKPFVKNDTIFYNMGNLRADAYQFRFGPENIQANNLSAFLVDRYLNTMTPVSLTDSTFIDFTIINEEGSYAADRFYLVFQKRLHVAPPAAKISAIHNSEMLPVDASITVHPNPLVNKVLTISFTNQPAGTYQLELSNKLGQVIFTRIIKINDPNLTESIQLGKEIAVGNYQLSIIGEKGKKTVQQVVIN